MMKKLFTLLATLFISLTTYAESQNFEYIKSYVPAKITNISSDTLKDTVIIKSNDNVITKLITYKIKNNELHIIPKVPMSNDCIMNLINNDINSTSTKNHIEILKNNRIKSITNNKILNVFFIQLNLFLLYLKI